MDNNGPNQAVAALFNDASSDAEMEEIDISTKEDVPLGKRFLIDLNPNAAAKYRDYLKEQLLSGEGETVVEIGTAIDTVEDEKGLNEAEASQAEQNHNKLLASINCVGTTLSYRCDNNCHTRVVMIRSKVEETNFIEVRIAVVGNVDAGKSTLLGVLTHNILDDGRGHARKKLFKHKHEFETGRTSSVGNDILGFDAQGVVTNRPNHHGRLDWIDICRESAKVVTFIDLAGHEKYLKTTIFGLTGHMPDYTMLMVGANAGIIGTAREHLSLALSLGIPVLIVVTKIDMCPPQILTETMQNLDKLMKSPGARKRPLNINCAEDVIEASRHFYSGKVCPIFQVSNVKGTNLDLLRMFLNVIPVSRPVDDSKPAEFQIDEIFQVDGVGTVVSGTCLVGTISLNDTLLIGPDTLGAFHPVPIKSIHRKRMPVSTVKAGQTASFALRKLTKKDVRKGMFMLAPSLNPAACFEFVAEVLILHHPTTIAPNYQAMVHVGSIRQTATILSMNKECLRTGDRDSVTLKFIRHPEYLRTGTRMVFREGRTKAVGTVRQIIPYTSQVAQQKPLQKTYLGQKRKANPLPPLKGKGSKAVSKQSQ
ncbi:elongation factor tu GTP binding domain-containing protein [Ditylenchus destructor]|nr:elongation factor tu GTP binding domain-containing protein [Ditylenchus destructor]